MVTGVPGRVFGDVLWVIDRPISAHADGAFVLGRWDKTGGETNIVGIKIAWELAEHNRR
jgi:hypothetical protein